MYTISKPLLVWKYSGVLVTAQEWKTKELYKPF